MKRTVHAVNFGSKDRELSYTEVSGKLKYRLEYTVSCFTGIRVKRTIVCGRIVLKTTGRCYLLDGYRWNGSNLVPDTDECMRGSAFHDALCVLMEIGLLSRHYQTKVNDLYQAQCKDDGMSLWRNQLRRAGLKFYWIRIRRVKKYADLRVDIRGGMFMDVPEKEVEGATLYVEVKDE